MNEQYFIYAIASLKKNYIYVGMTGNVIQRVSTHQYGKNKTTKPYLPFCLIYTETTENRRKARAREKYWKQASGKRKLRIIRKNIFEECGFDLPD